jgi:hypothetical protein
LVERTVLDELHSSRRRGREAAGAMPPKPAAAKGGKEKSKADVAKKQKLVEDKTFGLKNKNKSKNVQKFVQSLTQSVQPNPKQTDAKAALKVRCSFLSAPYSLSLSPSLSSRFSFVLAISCCVLVTLAKLL